MSFGTWLDGMRQSLTSISVPLLLVVLVALCAIGAFLLERIVIVLLRSRSEKTKTRIDDAIVRAAHPGLTIGLFVLFMWFVLRFLPLGLSPLATGIVNRIGGTLILVAAGMVVVRLATSAIRIPAQRDPRWWPVSSIGSRVGAAVIWIAVGLMILNLYGVEITPLLATLGIGGIAVALALQGTLASFFAGIWMQTGRALMPGNYIRLEDAKLEGYIDEIGWRTTKIRTLGGTTIILTNDKMSQAIVTNYSLPGNGMGQGFELTTGFETDPDQVLPILLEEVQAAAKESDLVLDHPEPQVRLNGPVENGWEFHVGYWIPTFPDQWNAKAVVWQRIRRRFVRERIRIPYPMAEQYAVPPNRVDVAKSITAAAYVKAAPSNGEGADPLESVLRKADEEQEARNAPSKATDAPSQVRADQRK